MYVFELLMYVRLEVLTAVTIKNTTFWDITRHFGEKYRFHLQDLLIAGFFLSSLFDVEERGNIFL
jgi:hypothetical protein